MEGAESEKRREEKRWWIVWRVMSGERWWSDWRRDGGFLRESECREMVEEMERWWKRDGWDVEKRQRWRWR
jgi:hypothetical protein